MKTLVKGEDYYFDERGFFVFTAKYHQARGTCCGHECRECPFEYEGVPEPRRTALLTGLREQQNKGENSPDDLG